MILNKFKKAIGNSYKQNQQFDELKILTAQTPLRQILSLNEINTLTDAELKVFSQWGDDGIIQFLIHNLNITNNIFVEFGVQDYLESNTRFLLMNNNWTGYVMDSSQKFINSIKNSYFYPSYDLVAQKNFITKDNINSILKSFKLPRDIGLLHIDIDGNDYWVWEEIDVISPSIVIIEYNSLFGSKRSITVPYNEHFNRTKAHYSNLYFGASLPALIKLANQKDYTFIGSNSNGNNAYFIRNHLINDIIKEVNIESGYVLSKFRESRDQKGNLTFLRSNDRLSQIKHLPVFNVITNKIEKL